MARILFVDDDPLTLETLKRSVELFGHEPLLANSGEQALSLAISQPPDLIMTDMMLPDMDGLALISRLNDNPKSADIPVVVLSASPEVDAAELSRAVGAKEFITKPVRLQNLQDLIQRYTGE